MMQETILIEAIKLNEQAVRAVDTKAQIFIGAILFGANSLGAMLTLLGGHPFSKPNLAMAWIGFTGITLLSLVRVVAPVPFGKRPQKSKLLFSPAETSVDQILGLLPTLDAITELAAELADIQHIRCVKIKRMNVATILTAILVFGLSMQVAAIPYLNY